MMTFVMAAAKARHVDIDVNDFGGQDETQDESEDEVEYSDAHMEDDPDTHFDPDNEEDDSDTHFDLDDEEDSQVVEPLTELTLPLSDEVSVERLAELRHCFIRKLAEVDVSNHTIFLDSKGNVKKHIRPKNTAFSKAEQCQIADFVFLQFFGKPAQDRIRNIITYHNQPQSNNAQFVTRARNASLDKSNPFALRKLFAAMVQSEIGGDGNNKSYDAVHRHESLFETLYYYTKVVKLAKAGDNSIRQALTDRGFGTKQGVNWASASKSLVASAVGQSPAQISNKLQQAQMVTGFIERWGNGFFLCLPPNFLSL
jgi:hypothetical protein